MTQTGINRLSQGERIAAFANASGKQDPTKPNWAALALILASERRSIEDPRLRAIRERDQETPQTCDSRSAALSRTVRSHADCIAEFAIRTPGRRQPVGHAADADRTERNDSEPSAVNFCAADAAAIAIRAPDVHAA